MLINLRGMRESGTIFAAPDLHLPRLDARVDRARAAPDHPGQPAARDRRDARDHRPRVPRRAPADAGLRRRLQRDHRRRGGLQRCPRLQAARVAERPNHAHGDGRPGRPPCSWACHTWPASRAPRRPTHEIDRVADRARGVRHRADLLRAAARDDRHAGPGGNTSFADFPRLSSILARDGYMPTPVRVPRRAARVQRRHRRAGRRSRSSSWSRSAAW